MLYIGGLAAYTFVWDLGDIGVGLMTVFNMVALIPLADYEGREWGKMVGMVDQIFSFTTFLLSIIDEIRCQY